MSARSHDPDDCDENQAPERYRFPRRGPCGVPRADRRVVLIIVGAIVFVWRASDGTYTVLNQGVNRQFQRQLALGVIPTAPRLTMSPGITTLYL